MLKRIFLIFLCWQSLRSGAQIVVGAAQVNAYLPFLKEKRVALAVNQTSTIAGRHLVDTLQALGVNIVAVFAPEHGFRGDHGAGESVSSGYDAQSGIAVHSLYGKNKKPSNQHMMSIDIVVFDIQDVGARFYTFISTLHYLMEACAENNKPLLLLDRPNPNGNYIDGPVLDTNFRSFVGMHPVPVVHGLTVAEYAQMINGERWLNKNKECNLAVVTCLNYTHSTTYVLPIKPSPNLPSQQSIRLYPSLCFFEGAAVSLGRGTNKPFEQIGAPWFLAGKVQFSPKDIPGVALNPPYANQICYGYDLSDSLYHFSDGLILDYLIEFYQNAPDKKNFFNSFFDKLAGTNLLREQIISGKTSQEIKQSWQKDLEAYKKIRKQYLLYPDFDEGK
jgi:uncharacterized protein YbbC (DUF1343 family)